MFHTLYGDVELDSPRLHRCTCQAADGPATMSPLRDLISSHLEARWSSLAPYAAATGLLVFGRWYPGLANDNGNKAAQADAG